MAFTWTSNNDVEGEFISAASVNEVRNLLNTMYNQVSCSTRNAVVYSSDNSGYDSSKDSSIVACTTVYASRNSSYCTAVNATQTTTSYSGDAAGCTNNNGSQYVNNACTGNNASNWTADNNSNNVSDCSENVSGANTDDFSSDNSGNCYRQQYTCTGDNVTDYEGHSYTCTSVQANYRSTFNGNNWTTDNDSRWSGDGSSCPWQYTTDFTGDCGSDYTAQGDNICSSRNVTQYGSKAFCPSYNNTKYSGKNSANKNPYNASARVCSTVHAANG